MQNADKKAFTRELTDRINGDVAFDEMTLGIYATDASIYQVTPVAVVMPRDEQDVLAAVRIAAEYGVCILPRGAGTSLNGQAERPGCQ